LTDNTASEDRPLQALPRGVKLNGFVIEGLIRQSALSILYQGLEVSSGRAVLIKEFFPLDAAVRQARSSAETSGLKVLPRSRQQEPMFKAGLALFQRQARLLGGIRHPHIVRVEKLLQAHNTSYLVMPKVAGRPLSALLDHMASQMDGPAVRAVLLPVLSALGTVHKAGFLHRDVTPDNVLLQENGAPLLLDFSASLPLDSQDPIHDAFAESALLTPGYAPLEQYWQGGEETPATDFYGLAALAYSLITGKAPLDALTRAHGDGALSLVTYAADHMPGRYPPGLLRALEWGLALQVSDRPQTADSFAKALQQDDWQWPQGQAEAALLSSLMQTETELPQDSEDKSVEEEEKGEATETPSFDGIEAAPTVKIDRIASLPPLTESEKDFLTTHTETHQASPPHFEPQQPVPPQQKQPLRPWLFLGGILGLCAVFFLSWPFLKSEWGVDRRILAVVKAMTGDPWIVDPKGGGDAKTITEAMEFAFDHSLFHIQPGRYEESLQIDKMSFTFQGMGESPKDVQIRPANSPCLVAQTAQSLVLRNLHMRNSIHRQAARDKENGDASEPQMDVTAQDCLLLQGGKAILEKVSIASETGSAVRVGQGAALTFTEGEIGAARGFGLELRQAGAVALSKVEIHHAGKSGVLVQEGGPVLLSKIKVSLSKQAGLVISSGAVTVEKSELVQNRRVGLEVRGPLADVTITENRLADNAQAGMYLHEGAKGTFLGNHIEGNRYSGIVIDKDVEADIQANIILSNREHGVLLLPQAEGRLQANEIRLNRFYGIAQSQKADTEIADNIVEGNEKGEIQEGLAPL